MVFVPFSPPANTKCNQIDDTTLLHTLRKAGDAVSLFISLGKSFDERSDVQEDVDKRLGQANIELNMRVRRTYTILLSFTLLVS